MIQCLTSCFFLGTTFEERLDEIREMDLPEPEKRSERFRDFCIKLFEIIPNLVGIITKSGHSRSKIDQYEANLLYSDFYVEEQHLKSLGRSEISLGQNTAN